MWGRNNTFVFNNPFWVVPAVSSTTVVEVPVWLDYSRPLPAPVGDFVAVGDLVGDEFDDLSDSPPPDPAAVEAIQLFDQARTAFQARDFKRALELIDESIALSPSDATLHEFRALCLFALKDFQQAAGTIYAVLAAGPGWNWETLVSLYASVSVYTEQLRALESHVRANPDDAAATFLLAYHYITMGHLESAVKQLEQVTRLLPDDQLSAQLLEAFRQAGADSTAPLPAP
jgi:thioredoxin-like negative regulator of GroEL